RFKAGDYRFTNKMLPSEVMAIIMSGVSYGMQLPIPEGFNMAQIAEALDKVKPGSRERFLELCADRKFIATLELSPGGTAPATLEGYLFPETYLVGRKTPEEEVIRQMVRKFKGVFTPELRARAKEIGLSEHETITLASIIEKETGAPDERPLISSVFHNRLKKHMKLQTDPTVIYGIRNYNGNITRKDLETPTPYNTYFIPGLPPGPIASPGKDAIVAALYPKESPYLFFVSHNDGTHEFTSTYDDHRKAVTKFQLDPKAREGKSWRDLSKRLPQGPQSGKN
ncbi:MAG: endolytic transglycosylase MltG, partial [Deltaproteobacteria bacterium]|nr:endolytic transglycosylase MltG [Deltaproteobacteria bacterium]